MIWIAIGSMVFIASYIWCHATMNRTNPYDFGSPQQKRRKDPEIEIRRIDGVG